MATTVSDTFWSGYFPTIENIEIDGLDYPEDASTAIAYPDISIDISIPDVELEPPCPEGRPPTKPSSNLDEPTDRVTKPLAPKPDKTRPFKGTWYVEPPKIATCGGCNEKDVVTYIRHCLVASTDLRLTRLLRAGKFEVLKDPKYRGKYIKKSLTTRDHLKQDADEVYKSDPSRGYRFTYRYKMSFPELPKCRHLAVFFYSEIDTQNFVRDYNLSISPGLSIRSNPISETVIENSKIKSQSTVYKNSKTGAIYNGKSTRTGTTSKNQSHTHKYVVDFKGDGVAEEACSSDGVCHTHKIVNGVVMPARGAGGMHKHSIGDVPTLTRRSAVNAKLKNDNALRKVKKIHLDLAPQDNTQKISIKDADKYIPFFGLSCDPPKKSSDGSTSNVARFYFDLNIEEVLRKTEFGGIFDKNLTDCCRQRIFDLSKIIAVEVRRRRIGDFANRDKVVTNDLTELIAYSGDKPTDMFVPYEFLEQTREVVIEPKKSGCDARTKKIGILKEIFMNYASGVRTFTGTDYNLPQQGKYEYCVSVKVRNGITLFLNENLTELILMRKKLQKWYEFSMKSDYVDKHKNSFNKRYKDLVHCDPKGKVDKDKGDNPYLTIVDDAIILLAKVLSCLTNYEHINKGEMVDLLFSKTNAETGNLDGIRIVAELYDLLILELKKVLGSKEFRIENQMVVTNDTLYRDAKSYASKALKDVIDFEKCFKDINCPCAIGGTWFDFLGIDANSFDGMKEINPDDYLARVDMEYEKFMGSTGTATLAGGNPMELMSLLNGNSDDAVTLRSMTSAGGFSSFLTAFRVRIGDREYDLSKLKKNFKYYNELYQKSQTAQVQGSLHDTGASFSSGWSSSDVYSPGISFPGTDTWIDNGYGQDPEFDVEPAEGSAMVGVADVMSPTDPMVDWGISTETQGNCEIMPGTDAPALQTALNNMLTGCPSPCGEDIRYIYRGLDKPTDRPQSDIHSDNPQYPPRDNPEFKLARTPPKAGTPSMPPQLLSLLGSPNVEVQLKTIPELRSMLLFNYDIIAISEALVYVQTSFGMQKQWVPLTNDMVIASARSPILVRLRKYSERKWGMRECPEFEVSFCDSYYILGDTSNKKNYCQEEDTQVRDHLINQQKVYRNVDVNNVATIDDTLTAADTTLRLL